MNTPYDPTADNLLDDSGWEGKEIAVKPAPNKAQHSPLPWTCPTCETFDLSCPTCREHNHADKLAEQLRKSIEDTRFIYGKAKSDNQNLSKLQREMQATLTEYERAAQ